METLSSNTIQHTLPSAFWECRHYLVPQWRHAAVYLILTLCLISVGEVVALVSTDLLTNKIFLAEPMSAFQANLLGLDEASYVNVEELSEGTRLVLRVYFLVLIGSLLGFAFVLGQGLNYYLTWILQRVNQHLREVMMDRALQLSLRHHNQAQAGDAIYRLFQDSAMVTAVIQTVLIQPIVIFGSYVILLIVLGSFSPYLASLFVLATVPSIACMLMLTKNLQLKSRAARESNSALTAHIQESIQGAKVLKAIQGEPQSLDQFTDLSQTALDRAYELRRTLTLLNLTIFFTTALVTLLTDYLVTTWVWEGKETFGYGALAWVGYQIWNLAAFQATRNRTQGIGGSLVGMATTWTWIQDMGIGLRRALYLLRLPVEIEESTDAVELTKKNDVAIEFRGITFGYELSKPVLQDVSFKVEPGTVTALLGPSGAGKSTLVSLLLRLYDVNDGVVLVDEKDVKNLKINTLRQSIATALQENTLFPTTIEENIRYTAMGASNEALAQAIYVSCADEFISTLPDGLQTELGERGSKLSTGQRQRITIARAIVKDAPVLILDEPTAALDGATEQRLISRVREWAQTKAVILITHRVSLTTDLDQIVLLQNGRVMEAGSPSELLANEQGEYRRLMQLAA